MQLLAMRRMHGIAIKMAAEQRRQRKAAAVSKRPAKVPMTTAQQRIMRMKMTKKRGAREREQKQLAQRAEVKEGNEADKKQSQAEHGKRERKHRESCWNGVMMFIILYTLMKRGRGRERARELSFVYDYDFQLFILYNFNVRSLYELNGRSKGKHTENPAKKK